MKLKVKSVWRKMILNQIEIWVFTKKKFNFTNNWRNYSFSLPSIKNYFRKFKNEYTYFVKIYFKYLKINLIQTVNTSLILNPMRTIAWTPFLVHLESIFLPNISTPNHSFPPRSISISITRTFIQIPNFLHHSPLYRLHCPAEFLRFEVI